ncbi:MAG: aspartyl protease [Planctomycetes bacterium RBG_16_55_9]|nr:MAG: aspartyl protease [Planctomycetes bacterium RBG_16_55_9]
MGHTWVNIKISDLDRKHSRTVHALVDTGASLTTLPEKIAEELGIKPTTEERVSMGAGIVKISRGRAWIKMKGKEDAFPIWISDFIDKVLLGVVVLESFGFTVDPSTGKLEERPLLLY